jgi:hypothetical protein
VAVAKYDTAINKKGNALLLLTWLRISNVAAYMAKPVS